MFSKMVGFQNAREVIETLPLPYNSLEGGVVIFFKYFLMKQTEIYKAICFYFF